MNRSTIGRSAVMALASLVAGTALAQTAKPVEGTPDHLAGPTVKETKEERSLIRRNFEGRMQRLEMTPDEAAVELLTLDADAKARVRSVLDEYNATLDRLVAGNLELLVKFTSTPGRRERLELVRQAKEAFKDLDAKGTLKDRVVKELPKEQAERYTTLINGYWEVLIDDAVQQAEKEAKDRARVPGRGEIVIRETLVAFGQEVKRSYERQIAAKTKELEAFLKKLDLAPEKETKIRNMFVEFEERTKGAARPEQRRELATRVFRELNKEQQRILLEELFKPASVPPASTPAQDPKSDAPMDGDKKDSPDHPPMDPMKDR